VVERTANLQRSEGYLAETQKLTRTGRRSLRPRSREASDKCLIKGAVSAPLLWLSLRDWRLAVGSGLVPSIPVFR
jgi:hypothetical protein